MTFQYNPQNKSFSLTLPNLSKLEKYLRDNFDGTSNCPVSVALGIGKLFGKDDQLKIRNKVIIKSQNLEDEQPIDIRSLYFIGKSDFDEVIGIHKNSGEVYEIAFDEPQNFCSTAPNIRDYAKNILDSKSNIQPTTLSKAKEFARNLMNNI